MGAQQPCCQGACQAAGLEKYYSVAKSMTGVEHCGECCMDPKKYKLYHFFEKNLTKATDDSPCKGFGFTKYDSTVTHGFGPVKMTLDLYDKPAEEPSFLADVQFVEDPVSCMKSKCPSQISKCMSDAKCNALLACAAKCAPSDSACIKACAKGGIDGAVLGMVMCAKKNGCFSDVAAVPNGPPNGLFCGKVPFIISMNMTVNAATMTFDYNNDIKVAHKSVSCSGEKFKYDGTNFDISGALADPNDCLAKAISQDAKSKPTITFDGTNIVAKNGYGTLKLKPKLSPGATCD